MVSNNYYKAPTGRIVTQWPFGPLLYGLLVQDAGAAVGADQSGGRTRASRSASPDRWPRPSASPSPSRTAFSRTSIERLARIRWPLDPGNEDWRYGTNRAWLEDLVDYWRNGYDWRVHEAAMNRFEHYRVELDEVPIHYIHRRGVGPDPMPLVLTHGWPWTFWDFAETIDALADPASHGGDPADAFDVVVPSLPGYGYSVPLLRTGVTVRTTAALWVRLMQEVLGYGKFGAHGGDWGASVTAQLGHEFPEHMVGVHLSLPVLMRVSYYSRTLGRPTTGRVKRVGSKRCRSGWPSPPAMWPCSPRTPRRWPMR